MYIRWRGTRVHIAGTDQPVVYPHRYGRFKRALCGKEYEIECEVIRSEVYAQAHLCRSCARALREGGKQGD
jgi:hypothetical protein